jgi:phage recombination protein Bet
LVVASTDTTPSSFTPQQIEIIKNSVAKGVSDQELDFFLEVCRSTGLNPLHRQIYAIMRSSKGKDGKYSEHMTIQTGIDGYRLLAHRSGRHAGTDDAIYDTETETHPNKATVTVYKMVRGVRCPFTATARWSEYKHSSPMWSKMPYLMLAKVAEALALRKAFPAETSGLYTDEEMMQADNAPEPAPRQIAAPVLVTEQSRQPATPAPEPYYEPTEHNDGKWRALKKRLHDAGMCKTKEQFDLLMEETGGSYEETLAKVERFEQHDLHELGNGAKGRH